MFLPINRTAIYALVDPRDGLIRYVGRSANPNRRMKDHVLARGSNELLKAWLEELIKEKVKPLMIILDTCQSEKSDECEKHWIDHFKKFGQLLNYRKK